MIMTVTEELRQEARREGLREGLQEGIIEGRKDAQVQIVKAMLADNMSVEKIAMYSGLAVSDVQKIAASCS